MCIEAMADFAYAVYTQTQVDRRYHRKLMAKLLFRLQLKSLAEVFTACTVGDTFIKTYFHCGTGPHIVTFPH